MSTALLPILMAAVLGAPPVVPPPPPTPVLYVQSITEGKTTYYPGGPIGRAFQEPVAVGLRPGYIYRVKLLNSTGEPTPPLYPSLEVVGSLREKSPGFALKFPVPMIFPNEDIAIARSGGMVTRVYYLEDPAYAEPVTVDPNRPVELAALTEADALKMARTRGRLVLTSRLGERQVPPSELLATAVPGTVLLPGEPGLPAPSAPPVLKNYEFPFYDPLLGPQARLLECLHDGGDGLKPLGIDPEGKLAGLDPSDTSLEYTDAKKTRRVTTSNRVCLCVPRFVSVRVVTLPTGTEVAQPPIVATGIKGPSKVDQRIPPRETANLKQPIEVASLRGPTTDISIVSLIGLEAIKGYSVAAQVEGTAVTIGQKSLDDVTAYPECKPLVKWVDPPTGHRIGDVVTFYLRYRNTGTKPMENVVVSDSLTARLEYVTGTAQSDREAAFTATPNEAGSTILRWAVTAPLNPGQEGTVSFKAKIR